MSEMSVEQSATIIRERLREGAGCIHAEFVVTKPKLPNSTPIFSGRGCPGVLARADRAKDDIVTKQGGAWGRIATAARRVLRVGLRTDGRRVETTVKAAAIAKTAPVPMLHRASETQSQPERLEESGLAPTTGG